MFDDDAYESRTPDEWVPADQSLERAPGEVLLLDKNGSGTWRRCRAVAVRAASNEYLLEFEEEAGEGNVQAEAFWIHRLFIHFDAEDPNRYRFNPSLFYEH